MATTGSPAGPLSIAGAALLLAGILLVLVLRKRRVGDES
ncbi:LPXTG cell wall anchor domain-containing protein [Saccharopolyspora shandongensis]